MNVKKVVLVDAITQKKIVNVETAKQEIVIAISMPHKIFTKKRDLVFYGCILNPGHGKIPAPDFY